MWHRHYQSYLMVWMTQWLRYLPSKLWLVDGFDNNMVYYLQSYRALHCWPTLNWILISPKLIIDSKKNESWIRQIKKFSILMIIALYDNIYSHFRISYTFFRIWKGNLNQLILFVFNWITINGCGSVNYQGA